MNYLIRAAVAALSVLWLAPLALAYEQRPAGDFDFYVLSLSWSPSFCAQEDADSNTQQCGLGKPYGFIVHGLWPQYERGYPRDCPTGKRRVPNELARTLEDIMPSAGLVGYQWRTHGACSGLSQSAYFQQVRAAQEKVEIPMPFRQLQPQGTISAGDVEQAFIEANPGMSKAGVSVSCGKRLLREVRVCLTRDLEFRSCAELERKACRAESLKVPPVRGR